MGCDLRPAAAEYLRRFAASINPAYRGKNGPHSGPLRLPDDSSDDDHNDFQNDMHSEDPDVMSCQPFGKVDVEIRLPFWSIPCHDVGQRTVPLVKKYDNDLATK